MAVYDYPIRGGGSVFPVLLDAVINLNTTIVLVILIVHRRCCIFSATHLAICLSLINCPSDFINQYKVLTTTIVFCKFLYKYFNV